MFGLGCAFTCLVFNVSQLRVFVIIMRLFHESQKAVMQLMSWLKHLTCSQERGGDIFDWWMDMWSAMLSLTWSEKENCLTTHWKKTSFTRHDSIGDSRTEVPIWFLEHNDYLWTIGAFWNSVKKIPKFTCRGLFWDRCYGNGVKVKEGGFGKLVFRKKVFPKDLFRKDFFWEKIQGSILKLDLLVQ